MQQNIKLKQANFVLTGCPKKRDARFRGGGQGWEVGSETGAGPVVRGRSKKVPL